MSAYQIVYFIHTYIMLHIELWDLIRRDIDFLDEIRLTQVCRHFYAKIEIYDLSKSSYAEKLNDDIISRYQFITRLRIVQHVDNMRITKIDHLQNLRHLFALSDCGISNVHISSLTKLETLVVSM